MLSLDHDLAHGHGRQAGNMTEHGSCATQQRTCNGQVRLTTICQRAADINWYPCSKICAGYQTVSTIGLFMRTYLYSTVLTL